ncbi:hypothetical protein [Polaromonas sp. UBA4122]|uniref:hypothetical protein n=1 Tax=Polaromonas sp. UBA4122 TaxID=1947074 RepID=UPI0025F05A08|nr:hypothetical protein [Polaromonas sp. UBA4122]
MSVTRRCVDNASLPAVNGIISAEIGDIGTITVKPMRNIANDFLGKNTVNQVPDHRPDASPDKESRVTNNQVIQAPVRVRYCWQIVKLTWLTPGLTHAASILISIRNSVLIGDITYSALVLVVIPQTGIAASPKLQMMIACGTGSVKKCITSLPS